MGGIWPLIAIKFVPLHQYYKRGTWICDILPMEWKDMATYCNISITPPLQMDLQICFSHFVIKIKGSIKRHYYKTIEPKVSLLFALFQMGFVTVSHVWIMEDVLNSLTWAISASALNSLQEETAKLVCTIPLA